MPPLKSDSVAQSLLSRAHSLDSATRIFTEKIKKRPLLLKPTDPTNARDKRRVAKAELRKRKKKLRPKPLTAREKRATCIYEIPKSQQKYEIYEPLHRMWIGYIQEVLGENCTPVTSGTAAKLVSADYHGAELEVVRSRCVTRVGVKGIVVRDSRFVFQIITKDNALKMVPKEHTVFRFEVPSPGKHEGGVNIEAEGPNEKTKKSLVFELHGEQFQYRSADRANKKFKAHFLPDL